MGDIDNLIVDKYYRVNSREFYFVPFNSKVKLLGITKYKEFHNIYGAIVELKSGPSYRFAPKERYDIVKQSDNLTDDSTISFVSPSVLVEVTDDYVINYSLNLRNWTAKESDAQNRYSKAEPITYAISSLSIR